MEQNIVFENPTERGCNAASFDTDTVTTSIELPDANVTLFGYSPASRQDIIDAAQRAVDERKPELLSELPGNHTIILDERNNSERKLHIITDPIGNAPPVYYSEANNTTTVSLRPSLAAGAADITPEAHAIAALLTIDGAEGSLLTGSSSIEGVSKVPPGSILHATNKGVALETYESLTPNKDVSLEAAAEQVAIALSSAIEARLSSAESVTADLSGGVDSSSVAFLVTRYLQKELPVFFSRNPEFPAGDELYARQFASLAGNNMRLRTLEHSAADLAYTLNRYDDLPSYEDAAVSAVDPSHLLTLKKYYGQLAESGSQLHFTGAGGDELARVEWLHLPNLLRDGNVLGFALEGLKIARLSNMSPLKLWASTGELTLRGPQRELRSIANRLRSPEEINPAWEASTSVSLYEPSSAGVRWLTSPTREKLAVFLEEHADAFQLPEGMRIGDYLARVSIYCSGMGNYALERYAQAFGGMQLHGPLLDKDVVRAAFSTPAENRSDIVQFKKLLAVALADLVPPEIFERRSKGAYDSEPYTTFRQSLPAIRQIVNSSVLAELGIIDSRKLADDVSRMEALSFDGLLSLETFLGLEKWARGLYGTPDAPSSGSNSVFLAAKEITPPAAKPSSSEVSITDKSDDHLALSSAVFAVSSETGMLTLYDTKGDNFLSFDPTTSNMIRAFVSSGNFGAAEAQLCTLYPKIDAAQIRHDLRSCIDKLADSGILVASKVPSTQILPRTRTKIDFAEEEHMITQEQRKIKVSLHERLLAAATLVGTVALTRYFPGKRKPLLDTLHKFSKGSASAEAGQRYQYAVQSIPLLGRIACAEAPYSAALVAAVKRQRLDWKVGVGFDPVTFHAWVEADGSVIRTPKDGPVVGKFESFFKD